MDSSLSASDVALLGDNSGMNGGASYIWILALIFLFMFSGNRNMPQDIATTSTVQDGFNFAALERQNNENVAAVYNAMNEIKTAVKDGNYNLLGEVRDLQLTTSTGFAEMQKSNTEVLRSIDNVNYNGALNKADIVAAIHAEGEATRNMYQQDRIADMQNRINQLELTNAMAGVVRYPNGMTYNAGPSPFCPSCSGVI